MSKSFFAVDELNSVAYECYSLVRFNYNNIDFLLYYFPENSSKYRILFSKVCSRNDGTFFLDNVSNTEKAQFSDIIYNVFVSLPSSYSKNIDFNNLISDFMLKNNIVFEDINFKLDDQNYDINSFLAYSNFDYVEYVASFYSCVLSRLSIIYNQNYKSNNTIIDSSSSYWAVPDSNYQINNIGISDNNSINTSNSSTLNKELGVGNVSTIISPDNSINSTNIDNSINGYSTNTNTNNYYNQSNIVAPSFSTDQTSEYNMDFSIDQHTLNTVNQYNVNTVNQPSNMNEENSINLNISSQLNSNESKILKNKNAGFASNGYIIIGSVCLIIAALIVAIAIILVKNL